MLIEARAASQILEQLRLCLQDELQRRNFQKGPKMSFVDTGMFIEYIKDGLIVTLQLTEESDSNESVLRAESEQEIPELNDIWDDALIRYAQNILIHVRNFARDKERVKREAR